MDIRDIHNFVKKSLRDKAFEKSRHRKGDNIKSLLRKLGCECTDWNYLVLHMIWGEDLGNSVKNLRVP
jgi:hypothetical protein